MFWALKRLPKGKTKININLPLGLPPSFSEGPDQKLYASQLVGGCKPYRSAPKSDTGLEKLTVKLRT